MNSYYNKYTFETFKLLSSLNNLDDKELIIDKEENMIIEAYYNELKDKIKIKYDQFLEIVKNLSIEYMKQPINIANIIYKELKNNNIKNV